MSNGLKCDEKLPKREVIRKARDFQEVFRNGKRWNGEYLCILYMKSKKRQVGFIVTKRLGGAVIRNRLKRRMREVYRKNRCEIGLHRIIMMVKNDFPSLKCNEIQRDFNRFLSEEKVRK